METIPVFKLFRQEPDGLHPLFIDSGKVLPIGEWLEARAPNDIAIQYVTTGFALIDLQHQKPLIIQDKRPRRNQITKATCDGCRWVEVSNGHVYNLGLSTDGQVIRFAHRPGWHSCITPRLLPVVNMTGKVWAECLIPSDDHYIFHRNISGLCKDHGPVDWYISQKIMIIKVIE